MQIRYSVTNISDGQSLCALSPCPRQFNHWSHDGLFSGQKQVMVTGHVPIGVSEAVITKLHMHFLAGPHY